MRRFRHHIWGFIACILLLIQDVAGCGGCNPGDGSTSNFCTVAVSTRTCGWWWRCRTVYRSQIRRTCCRGYKISNGRCVKDCGGCQNQSVLSQSACPVDVTKTITQKSNDGYRCIIGTNCNLRCSTIGEHMCDSSNSEICYGTIYRHITERKYTQCCTGYILKGQDCKKNCGGCASRSPATQDACQQQVTRRITATETYICPNRWCKPCNPGGHCECIEERRKKRSICTRVTYRYVRNTVYSCCSGFRRQGTQCICE